MKKSNVNVGLIVAVLIAPSLMVGCSQSEAGTQGEAESAEPRIAIWAFESEPVLDWDPSSGTSNETIVFNNVYETLTRYNAETEEVEPWIAESYESGDDGMTWTFTIRQGITFHDGTVLDAEAVRFSIQRTLDMNLGAAYIWDSVEEITVIDPYTVEFSLSYPAPLDYIACSAYGAFIMSPTAIEENPDDWLMEGNDAGSGPYMVTRSRMGEEVVLERFDDYWRGWNDNQFDTVLIQKVAESSSRRQLVESGEITVASELPSEDVEALRDEEGVKIVQGDTFTNMLIHFNTEKAPLDDVRVRKALSYAFPYEDVINFAAGGYGTQSRGVIPEGIMGYSEDLYQYSFDLEEARTLLSEAGYPEGGFSLSFNYVSGDETQKKMAELYMAELRKIGVELEIRGMPWDSYYDLAKAPNPEDRQDLFAIYWWPDNPLPISWFWQMYYTEEDILWNLSYYQDAQYDALVDEAEQYLFSDPDMAEEQYIEANRMLVEAAPTIFAYTLTRTYIVKSTVQGLTPNPAYDTVVYFYDLYEES